MPNNTDKKIWGLTICLFVIVVSILFIITKCFSHGGDMVTGAFVKVLP